MYKLKANNINEKIYLSKSIIDDTSNIVIDDEAYGIDHEDLKDKTLYHDHPHSQIGSEVFLYSQNHRDFLNLSQISFFPVNVEMDDEKVFDENIIQKNNQNYYEQYEDNQKTCKNININKYNSKQDKSFIHNKIYGHNNKPSSYQLASSFEKTKEQLQNLIEMQNRKKKKNNSSMTNSQAASFKSVHLLKLNSSEATKELQKINLQMKIPKIAKKENLNLVNLVEEVKKSEKMNIILNKIKDDLSQLIQEEFKVNYYIPSIENIKFIYFNCDTYSQSILEVNTKYSDIISASSEQNKVLFLDYLKESKTWGIYKCIIIRKVNSYVVAGKIITRYSFIGFYDTN